MNIHHLELFYYVARHGGILPAVRNMPYGIQQPAISIQILQLEDDLGAKLFQRRPFALTPAGEDLYRFIQPFFANLETTADRLRGREAQLLRIGASGTVLRDHLPEVAGRLRERFPRLKLQLREAPQGEIEDLLLRQEIDFGITTLQSRPTAGIKVESLLELPPVLLLPRAHKLQRADDLWQADRLEETLICLPPGEPLGRLFQDELRRRGVDWPIGIEVNSLELVERYVGGGFGLGVSVAAPRKRLPAGLRALALPGFPPVRVGALWTGRPSPLARALLELARKHAQGLGPPDAAD